MSNKLLLFVKAQTFRDVKTAGIERGLCLSDIAVNSDSFLEFRCRTSESNLLKVQRWFTEPGECKQGFGYPIGTLLFFRQEQ